MLIDLQAYINIPSPSANYRIILDILVGHLSRIHVHRIANRTRRGALSENPGPLNCAWPSTRNTTFPRPACVAPRAFRPFRPEWRYVCPSPLMSTSRLITLAQVLAHTFAKKLRPKRIVAH